MKNKKNRDIELKGKSSNTTFEEMPPIFGVSEIGKMLNWDKEKVHVYYTRGKLPEPSTYANSRPFWTFSQIKYWANAEYDININKSMAENLVHKSKLNNL